MLSTFAHIDLVRTAVIKRARDLGVRRACLCGVWAVYRLCRIQN